MIGMGTPGDIDTVHMCRCLVCGHPVLESTSAQGVVTFHCGKS